MMWLRIFGAVLATFLVVGGFEYLGLTAWFGERGDEAAHRSRELFWMMIFAVVMATAVLAAARRWADHARHAMATARRRR